MYWNKWCVIHIAIWVIPMWFLLSSIQSKMQSNCSVIKWNHVSHHESNDVDNRTTRSPNLNSPQNRGNMSQSKDCKALLNWFESLRTMIQSLTNYKSLTKYEILDLIKTPNGQQELQPYSQCPTLRKPQYLLWVVNGISPCIHVCQWIKKQMN